MLADPTSTRTLLDPQTAETLWSPNPIPQCTRTTRHSPPFLFRHRPLDHRGPDNADPPPTPSPGHAALLQVWDADKDTGKDFLGAVRLQLDGASGSKELELGPRLVIAEELVKEKYAPTGPAKKAKQGSVKLKWQYERNSSVKQGPPPVSFWPSPRGDPQM